MSSPIELGIQAVMVIATVHNSILTSLEYFGVFLGNEQEQVLRKNKSLLILKNHLFSAW